MKYYQTISVNTPPRRENSPSPNNLGIIAFRESNNKSSMAATGGNNSSNNGISPNQQLQHQSIPEHSAVNSTSNKSGNSSFTNNQNMI